MIACLDVGYHDSGARSSCVGINDWTDSIAQCEHVVDLTDIQPYVPGQFFRRELPCLLAALELLTQVPRVIVVDGYVWLNETGEKGLGAHLWESLDKNTPVVGVAKNSFRQSNHAVKVYRGNSGRPLYVTAVGLAPNDAADKILSMHGPHRMPTILKRVDQLSRT